MNLVKCSPGRDGQVHYLWHGLPAREDTVKMAVLLLLSIYLFGCSDQVSLPSLSQLVEFENAGPAHLKVDMGRLARAKMGPGAYRVVPDDVLELTMPTILRVVTAERPEVPEQVSPYVCRVSESGTITLPIVGEIEAAQKSLAEIESAIIKAYYPKYAVTRPSVFARILEYKTAKVSITGAVEKPGLYELRSDKMSLVALLMEAGGIIDEGASLIRITHPDESRPDNIELNMAGILLAGGFADENINPNTKLSVSDLRQSFTPEETLYRQLVETYQELLETIDLEKKPEIGKMDLAIPIERAESYKLQGPEPFVLPVKGFNIPFADFALQDGDSVVVERLEQPLVTVIGLVNKPGNFPYPPDVQYNLMQALGFAGGLDLAAEPRYVTVYRLKPDGGIISAIFKIVDSSKLTEALSTLIKPGDIVAVEHTPRTRAKLFLDRVFRINMGTYFRLNDAWDE